MQVGPGLHGIEGGIRKRVLFVVPDHPHPLSALTAFIRGIPCLVVLQQLILLQHQ